MKPRHQVSKQAIELIKRFEGYRRSAAALPDGRWTIGYGHIKTARAGAEVSESDAEALLIYDLLEVTRAVNDWTFTPLTQNQFDALVCFAFNVGLENFRRSTVLRRVNEGAMLQAACAFEMWRKAEFEGERIVIDALVRRRAAEKALFLTPTHGWVPAPSPVVRPRVDYDATAAQPRQRPLNLLVAMDGAEASAHQAPAEAALPDEDAAPSPAQDAADAVTRRLQALVPEPEPETSTAEAEASLDLPAPPAPSEFYPEPEAAPESEATDEPAVQDESSEPELVAELEAEEISEVQPEPEAAPEAVTEAEPQSDAGPAAADPFVLTGAPAEQQAEPAGDPLADEPAAEPDNSTPLPFDGLPFNPTASRSIPAASSTPRVTASPDFGQRPTPAPLGMPSEFGMEDAAPMRFTMGPLVILGIVGLALFGFSVVWAFTAVPAGGGASLAVSWIAGLAGIGCVVAAIYMLLAKLGGSED